MLIFNPKEGMGLQAQVVPYYINEKTGAITELFDQSNLHMYDAADIMAGLLKGDMRYRISHMIFEYQNTNGAPSVSPVQARANGRAYFDSITGEAPEFHDWLRVPIINEPRIQRIPDDSTIYSGNGVVFNATSAASETKKGESPAHNYYASAGDSGPSKIVAAYLVAAPKPSDPKQDKIFSGVTFSTPITMQPGHHIGVYWLQKYN